MTSLTNALLRQFNVNKYMCNKAAAVALTASSAKAALIIALTTSRFGLEAKFGLFNCIKETTQRRFCLEMHSLIHNTIKINAV